MKKAKNIDSVEHTWMGQTFQPDDEFEIPAAEVIRWGNDDTVLAAIADGLLQLGDGQTWFTGVAYQIAFLRDDLPHQVQTQFERTDLDLKISCVKAAVDANTGQAELSIKCPGTPGSGDGRFIAGGEFFFSEAHPGDRVTAINIVDVDNILGLGAETIVKTYHDDDLDAINRGWYVPIKFGHIQIETLGFYGFLPSGLYLEIYVQKAEGHYSGDAFANIFWGKST